MGIEIKMVQFMTASELTNEQISLISTPNRVIKCNNFISFSQL